MLKARPTNTFVKHPAYAKILYQYNERLQSDGKVNNKKFYEEVITKAYPGYALQSWYSFLKRFKTEAGLPEVEIVNNAEVPPSSPLAASQENGLKKTLMTNQVATATFMAAALNIGAERARMILENPQLLTAKEAVELSIKAMKAQDSRIHAVGKIREDNREEEKLARAFDGADYNG